MDQPFTISIISDTHLGCFNENDIMQDDSFKVFDDGLRKSVENNADIILHGGDLFDDKNPHRYILMKTIDIMRKYFIGEGECPEVISSNPLYLQKVNWQEEYSSIKLPFFVIQGNHDNRCGHSDTCSSDLLATSNLVNFFSPVSSIDEIPIIEPVLLSKGNKCIVIYGLGNMPEQSFIECIKSSQIQFQKPKENLDRFERICTILLIHQNRVQYLTEINDIENKVIECFDPDCKPDYIIWGHEHDFAIKDYDHTTVIQPGSSIITKEHNKSQDKRQMVILRIFNEKNQDQLEQIQYKEVRETVFEKYYLSSLLKGICEEELIFQKIITTIENLLDIDNGVIEVPESKRKYVRITLINDGLSLSPNKKNQIQYRFRQCVANSKDFIFLDTPHKRIQNTSNNTNHIPIESNNDSFFDIIRNNMKTEPELLQREFLINLIKSQIDSPQDAKTMSEIQHYLKLAQPQLYQKIFAESPNTALTKPEITVQIQKNKNDLIIDFNELHSLSPKQESPIQTPDIPNNRTLNQTINSDDRPKPKPKRKPSSKK